MSVQSHPAQRGGLGELSLDPRTIAPLVRKELRDALRNRWLLLYTLAFGALAVGLATLSQIGTGLSGFAGFGKMTASLVNLVLLVVPLMALTVGASGLSAERERGMLAYLLSQPVTRLEVFVAKFIGLGLALTGSISIGFGLSVALLAAHSGRGDLWVFVRLVGLSAMLAMAMLAVGMLLSVVLRRSSTAIGAAVFVWLGFVFVGDLGLMGATVIFRLPVQQLFGLSLVNPTQAFKLAAVGGFDSTLDLLGPAGLYGVQEFGPWLMPMLLGAMAAWIVVPLMIAGLSFARKPL
ncbi:MAG: ABC transporter permease subunit [Phycisphaerales bacterium]|nr:ABC transporter permease subunit [Phycisphaerales bacterium]